MIKRYCDCCGKEITERNIIDGDKNRITAQVKGKNSSQLMVEIVTAKDGAWNEGDFCKYCVIEAIKMAADRSLREPRR